MYKTLLPKVLSKIITAVVRRKSSLRDAFSMVRMFMTVFCCARCFSYLPFRSFSMIIFEDNFFFLFSILVTTYEQVQNIIFQLQTQPTKALYAG